MPHHSALSGSDLHEPKGVSTASANTVYVANGSGSGTWEKIGPSQLDSSVKNVNKYRLTVVIDDVSTAGTIVVPILNDSSLASGAWILAGAISGADSAVTIKKNNLTSLASLTVPFSGSGLGTQGTFTASSNTLSSGSDFISISTDGGSTGTVALTFVLEFTLS